ncbi:MAG: hypothetical protein WC473_03975 [Patescibacteria group bacterium]
MSTHKAHGDFSDFLDSRGVITYATGNEVYDGKLLKAIMAQQPKEGTFIDFYPATEIQSDLDLLEQIKGDPKYRRERSSAEVLGEAEVFRSIARRDWFVGAIAKKASEYDDLVHGTDVVAYIPDIDDPDNEEAMIPLAIDATVTTEEEVIDKKITTSLARVRYQKRSPGNRGGRLTKLKYIRDDDGQPLKRTMNHCILALTPDKAKVLGQESLGQDISPDIKLETELQSLLAVRRQALVHIIIILSDFHLWGINEKIKNELRLAFQQDGGRQLEVDIITEYLSKNIESLRQNLKRKKQAPEIAISLEEDWKIMRYFDQLIKNKKALEKNQGWFNAVYEDCFNASERVTDLILLNPYKS